jgi:hypothetical protein
MRIKNFADRRETADGGRRTADGGRRTADGRRRTDGNFFFIKNHFFYEQKYPNPLFFLVIEQLVLLLFN